MQGKLISLPTINFFTQCKRGSVMEGRPKLQHHLCSSSSILCIPFLRYAFLVPEVLCFQLLQFCVWRICDVTGGLWIRHWFEASIFFFVYLWFSRRNRLIHRPVLTGTIALHLVGTVFQLYRTSALSDSFPAEILWIQAADHSLVSRSQQERCGISCYLLVVASCCAIWNCLSMYVASLRLENSRR